jgi:hypothetical protein
MSVESAVRCGDAALVRDHAIVDLGCIHTRDGYTAGPPSPRSPSLFLNHSECCCARHDRTLLHWSAELGHACVSHLLIRSRADVNAMDGWARTSRPLSRARIRSLTLFCNRGGRTALFFSATNGHIGICHLLIDSRADVNAKNKCASTARHPRRHRLISVPIFAADGRAPCCCILLRKVTSTCVACLSIAELMSTQRTGTAALHLCPTVYNSNPPLHHRRCNSVMRSDGSTALSEALSQKNATVAAFLRSIGARGTRK